MKMLYSGIGVTERVSCAVKYVSEPVHYVDRAAGRGSACERSLKPAKLPSNRGIQRVCGGL